jgi:hypothetical protein
VAKTQGQRPGDQILFLGLFRVRALLGREKACGDTLINQNALTKRLVSLHMPQKETKAPCCAVLRCGPVLLLAIDGCCC